MKHMVRRDSAWVVAFSRLERGATRRHWCAARTHGRIRAGSGSHSPFRCDLSYYAHADDPRHPIEQMTLGNMRQLGVRSLEVKCSACRHEVVLNVDRWPDDMPVPAFGPRTVCMRCGKVGADLGRPPGFTESV